MSAPVDVHVLHTTARGAQQVQAAMTMIGRCAHVPPWPPAPIRTVSDLQHAEAAAALIRTRLSQRPCPCLRGLRAHILDELLRRWQGVSCTGRLAIRLVKRTSRASPEFAARFTEQARALAADTAWLTRPLPPTD
ncbi:hypothetical protein [Actinomadura violacea]|uniref:Uncharacterized protein n=1 Tax=Actinomadura violacea TaxID=2819934 RepID=A0ABS3S8V0_9ACTN|nr:hypothetical protein [Actinomadura violacea]MBO2464993.1 hypothetical protein [Actinomadura violacea]